MQPTQFAKDFKRLFSTRLTDALADLDPEDRTDLARFLHPGTTKNRPEEALEAIIASIHLRKAALGRPLN